VTQLARISVFPLKSLDGFDVPEIRVLPSGALAGDRQFRLVDTEGKVMNAKRTHLLHPLRATFGHVDPTVTLLDSTTGEQITLSLEEDRPEIAAWFSRRLGCELTLEEDTTVGFADDHEAPGPSVISIGTLREIASWFHGLTEEEARRRLRTNLEIDAEEPFWEDRLITTPGHKFAIGDVTFSAERICQRCIVPARDALTGELYHRFQKEFTERRRATLPPWSPARLFNHHYRVAINTRLVDRGNSGYLALGDKVVPLPG
jgi:uncharacterized protein